jgi:hypothetical protein
VDFVGRNTLGFAEVLEALKNRQGRFGGLGFNGANLVQACRRAGEENGGGRRTNQSREHVSHNDYSFIEEFLG